MGRCNMLSGATSASHVARGPSTKPSNRKGPRPPFSSQGCRHQCTSFHWWSGELTANYLAMQVALGFNTEREAGVAFFIVF